MPINPRSLHRIPVCECGSTSYWWIGRSAHASVCCVIECVDCGMKRESKAQACWEFPEKTLDPNPKPTVRHKKPPRATGEASKTQGNDNAHPATLPIANWVQERAEKMKNSQAFRLVADDTEQRKATRWKKIIPLDLLGFAAVLLLLWQLMRLVL